MEIRSAVMIAFNNAGEFYSRWKGPYRKAMEFGFLLRYRMERRATRVKTVDIEDLVGKWIKVLAQMCTAHDKDSYDAADAQSDELLGPILTAPVAQVRVFYARLLNAMEADPRIPWVVRIGFEAWGEAVVKNATDEGVKKLKNRLAGEIAELVEMDIREQIPEAIKRALRWRDVNTLEAVKEQLESGEKPKLKGRESCLFLEVGKGKRKATVML